jgi:beta-galactosidase
MNKYLVLGLFAFFGSLLNGNCIPKVNEKMNELAIGKEGRSVILLDAGWRFYKGDVAGAEMVNFEDSTWRLLDLPHDWSIENLPGTESPFNPDAISQIGGGFTTGGTGWYRKTFVVPSDQDKKRIVVQFDGVYMNP